MHNGEGAARLVRLRRTDTTDTPDIEEIQRFMANGGKRGKSPSGFGNGPYVAQPNAKKTAGFRAFRSDCERMLRLRAQTFAPLIPSGVSFDMLARAFSSSAECGLRWP